MGIGAVNASIPLQAKAPPAANPLDTIGQFAQVQNALNQNKMFPGQQQLQQQGIQSNQAGLVAKWRQQAAGALTPLLGSSAPIGLSDVTRALGGAEASGISTQPLTAQIMALPITGDPAKDNATLRSFIAANAQAPENAVGAVAPRDETINTGAYVVPGTTPASGMANQGAFDPAGRPVQMGFAPTFGSNGARTAIPILGGAPAGPGIPVGLSPGEATAPTALGVGPNGAPIIGTRQQFIDKAGAGLGTGRLPPALLNPNSPAGIQTSLGPAAEAALAAKGGQSATGFQDISKEGLAAQGQGAILGNMLADAKNFTTGPTALNMNKATLMRYAPAIANAFGVSSDAVAANESFDKLANQIAGAQGAGSDARLAVAQGGNPSSHLSQQGADLMLRQLQGNADYLQARAKLAAAYPDQSDRPAFEADAEKGGASLDPRAFQYARMTPSQRKVYAASLSPQDLARVRTVYNNLFPAAPAQNAQQ